MSDSPSGSRIISMSIGAMVHVIQSRGKLQRQSRLRELRQRRLQRHFKRSHRFHERRFKCFLFNAAFPFKRDFHSSPIPFKTD
jgi:hypothetical protein